MQTWIVILRNWSLYVRRREAAGVTGYSGAAYARSLIQFDGAGTNPRASEMHCVGRPAKPRLRNQHPCVGRHRSNRLCVCPSQNSIMPTVLPSWLHCRPRVLIWRYGICRLG
jgi:hypothetical protein